MNKNLLSCPFCGGEADCNNMGLVDHGNKPLWWVVCLECKVSTHGDVTKEAAIAAWNRREEKKAVICNYERIIENVTESNMADNNLADFAREMAQAERENKYSGGIPSAGR